jgi:hypothetical protein
VRLISVPAAGRGSAGGAAAVQAQPAVGGASRKRPLGERWLPLGGGGDTGELLLGSGARPLEGEGGQPTSAAAAQARPACSRCGLASSRRSPGHAV